MSPNLTNPRAELSRQIKENARRLGFDLVGIAPATPGLGIERLTEWLAADKQGEMAYMSGRRAARADPNLILDGVRSVVMVAFNYRTREPTATPPGMGKVSRYAWGMDYHDVLRSRLKELSQTIQNVNPEIRCRAVVDSAPLMERDYARLAGLGWFGKNTLLLHPKLGSWFFLAGLLIDFELEYDQPFETDHCGTCTQCLDACPTQAFDGPYQLNPQRCISYLTIEHKSPVPEPLRSDLGEWLFGCDVCQDVCPWNRKAPRRLSDEFAPELGTEGLPLRELLRITDTEFRTRFRGSPLFRTGRERLVRNAALVAGNRKELSLCPELEILTLDPDAGVRDAAHWALSQLHL